MRNPNSLEEVAEIQGLLTYIKKEYYNNFLDKIKEKCRIVSVYYRILFILAIGMILILHCEFAHY